MDETAQVCRFPVSTFTQVRGPSVGAPEGIRTPNLLIRSQMLYPLSYGRRPPAEVQPNDAPDYRLAPSRAKSPTNAQAYQRFHPCCASPAGTSGNLADPRFRCDWSHPRPRCSGRHARSLHSTVTHQPFQHVDTTRRRTDMTTETSRTPDTLAGGTTHPRLQAWVDAVAVLTTPDEVVWVTGSDQEWTRLTDRLVRAGPFPRLDPATKPNSFYARSTPNDVARVEDRTYICSREEK